MADELYDKQHAQGSPAASRVVTDVAARLKVLEERYNNLSRREQLSEQNMLSFERDLNAELKVLEGRVTETRRHVSEVREKLEMLQGQVAGAADKHDLRVLEAYLNIIEPLEYVTRGELKHAQR